MKYYLQFREDYTFYGPQYVSENPNMAFYVQSLNEIEPEKALALNAKAQGSSSQPDELASNEPVEEEQPEEEEEPSSQPKEQASTETPQQEEKEQPSSVAQEAKPQPNEKTIALVVSGEGMTKDEATKNALRSAIEQAFGTFVSANTNVVNDELVRDEIVTISSGNIQSYKELEYTDAEDVKKVTLKAVVSIGKLVSYAQSKGMSTELAGATFIMNKKIRDLNKKNEVKTFENLDAVLKSIASSGMYDYSIEIGEPRRYTDEVFNHQPLEGGVERYSVGVKVQIKANQNTINFYNTLFKTLNSLELSPNEIEEYNKANEEYEEWNFYNDDWRREFSYSHVFRGISMSAYRYISVIAASSALLGFSISDNIGKVICKAKEYDYYDISGLSLRIGKKGITFDYIGGMVCPVVGDYRSPQMIEKYAREWRFVSISADRCDYDWGLVRNYNSIPEAGELMYELRLEILYTVEELSKITSINIEPRKVELPAEWNISNILPKLKEVLAR